MAIPQGKETKERPFTKGDFVPVVTAATKPLEKENSKTSRLRRVDSRQYIATLRRSIHAFERRYEMSSEQMSKLLENSHDRETAEVLKWIQDYRVLTLLERKTLTTGIPSTTMSPSTRSA